MLHSGKCLARLRILGRFYAIEFSHVIHSRELAFHYYGLSIFSTISIHLLRRMHRLPAVSSSLNTVNSTLDDLVIIDVLKLKTV